MKRLFISLFTLTLLGSMSLASTMAYADCGSDKTQAISVIQNIKSVAAGNQAQAQAMSEQLAKLVESLSSQGCNSELLEVYRTMQREGLNGN